MYTNLVFEQGPLLTSFVATSTSHTPVPLSHPRCLSQPPIPLTPRCLSQLPMPLTPGASLTPPVPLTTPDTSHTPVPLTTPDASHTRCLSHPVTSHTPVPLTLPIPLTPGASHTPDASRTWYLSRLAIVAGTGSCLLSFIFRFYFLAHNLVLSLLLVFLTSLNFESK